MGLTSLKFIGLLGFLAVALFAATLWLWPRLAGRGFRPVLGRIGLFLAAQLAVVAVLGVVSNRYFAFYTTWDDLLGRSGKPQLTVSADRTPDGRIQLVKASGTEEVGVPGDKSPAKAGQIEAVDITGQRSGINSPAYVYLPPQYFQPEFKDRRFPVVAVLTGFPGDARNLITRLEVPKFATEEINAGRIQPTIFVLLRPTVTGNRDTECTDVPGGPQAGTFFSQDLPEAVRSAYRTVPGKDGWAFMGNSTGGYCAVKLAMLNSDRVGSAVGMSADYDAKQDKDTGDLYDGSKAFRKSQDLLWRLENLPAPPVNLLLTTSDSGEENYGPTMKFKSLTKDPMKVDTLVLPVGGHNFKTWQAQLPEALRWLSKRQLGDGPGAPAGVPGVVGAATR